MGLFGQTEIFLFGPYGFGKSILDIERLFATTVRYIYDDYHEKHDRLYDEYKNKSLWSKSAYDKKVQHIVWERGTRIVSLWKDLSYDEQIAFYLKTSAQETLLPYLTEDQACAIIIIQDQLIVYEE